MKQFEWNKVLQILGRIFFGLLPVFIWWKIMPCLHIYLCVFPSFFYNNLKCLRISLPSISPRNTALCVYNAATWKYKWSDRNADGKIHEQHSLFLSYWCYSHRCSLFRTKQILTDGCNLSVWHIHLISLDFFTHFHHQHVIWHVVLCVLKFSSSDWYFQQIKGKIDIHD